MSKALIISKENCGYCTRVRHVLNMKEVEFEEQKYDCDLTLEQIEEKVRQYIGENQLTFPQVFIDGEYIGGYTDVCKKYGINA